MTLQAGIDPAFPAAPGQMLISRAAGQGLAGGLKGEVRELLAAHGITSFVVKPVKRSYAFENKAIPHGQSWVLKVRYPGHMPTLPLGTTGACRSAAWISLHGLCWIQVCHCQRAFLTISSMRALEARCHGRKLECTVVPGPAVWILLFSPHLPQCQTSTLCRDARGGHFGHGTEPAGVCHAQAPRHGPWLAGSVQARAH